MKTAYPKTLLIAFENITPPNPVDFSTSMRDMAYQYKNRSYKIKPYHLHPGNEVARALNIIRGEGLLTCPKCGKIDEPAQVCQYCRHQWYTTSRLDRGCEKDIKL